MHLGLFTASFMNLQYSQPKENYSFGVKLKVGEKLSQTKCAKSASVESQPTMGIKPIFLGLEKPSFFGDNLGFSMVRNKVGHHGASALFIAALSAQSQMVSLLVETFDQQSLLPWW